MDCVSDIIRITGMPFCADYINRVECLVGPAAERKSALWIPIDCH